MCIHGVQGGPCRRGQRRRADRPASPGGRSARIDPNRRQKGLYVRARAKAVARGWRGVARSRQRIRDGVLWRPALCQRGRRGSCYHRRSGRRGGRCERPVRGRGCRQSNSVAELRANSPLPRRNCKRLRPPRRRRRRPCPSPSRGELAGAAHFAGRTLPATNPGLAANRLTALLISERISRRKILVPQERFELPTPSLRMTCSTS